MIQRILETIKNYNMIVEGDRVVVGVSGGPDSVCLLNILNSLKNSLNIKLYIAHIEHGFRGKASIEDAEFVKQLGHQMGIEVFIKYIDVPKFIEESGLSPEEAAREVRYDFYNQVLTKVGGNKVALGHNLDDQIETLIMRFLRGTGTKGLGGISPVRGDKFIRPLIETSRDDIMKFLNENNIKYRIDKTNLEDIYHRNSIRLRLIPLLEKEYNPNLKQTLARMVRIIREDNLYLEELAEIEYIKRSSKKREGIFLRELNIKSLPFPIKTRVMLKGIEEFKGSTKDVGLGHVLDVIALLESGTVGARVMLPEKMVIEKIYDGIYITDERGISNKFKPYEYTFKIPGRCYVPESGTVLNTQVISRDELKEIQEDPLIGQFDYDKIKGNLKIRNKRPGDRFKPLGLKGTKKLKDFFIDEKVPVYIRNKTPLLVSGTDIVWVIGFRISDEYKITDNTKKILLVKGEEKGGIK